MTSCSTHLWDVGHDTRANWASQLFVVLLATGSKPVLLVGPSFV